MAKKSLVIVESPAKAKTISKYLGSNFIVEASVGHIKNLPKSKLGIDLETYEPSYVTIKGKAPIIKRLRELAAKASDVYIATDPDREGEAIAWHLAREVEPKNDNILRVLFNEITKAGIAEAMAHPSKVDQKMVRSQQARRVMDRIIGYSISPFLWRAFIGRSAEALSAGRVQSVALRLVCERDATIAAFVPIEYWTISADFLAHGTSQPFTAKLVTVDGQEFRNPEGSLPEFLARNPDKKGFIADEITAQGFIKDAQKKEYKISSIEKKKTRRNAPAPFITSSLQQEASRRLRFSPKKTMMLAQRLYEGVEVAGEGAVGLITYMRTDSTRISPDAQQAAREYISLNYGKEYVPATIKTHKVSKGAQDAHEAIRPTSMRFEPRTVRSTLEKDMAALYELIWNRFLASQMSAAEIDQTTVDVSSTNTSGSKYIFRASGSVIAFRGFLQAYDDVSDEEDADAPRKLPADLKEQAPAALQDIAAKRSTTKPPGRFTESSLVKEMESLGIGRPSTYAGIVSTIQDRGYVEQRERRLFSTELGRDVNAMLVENFPGIFNVEFTARMEEELDTIAEGKQAYKKVLDDFYLPFQRDIASSEKRLDTPLPVCEKCAGATEMKQGPFGAYLNCTVCGNKKSLKQLSRDQEPAEETGEPCPDCKEGKLIIRSGKFGKFIACSRYPECKYTKAIPLGIKCPKCETGDVVQRRGGKFKRVFYGCSRYPECDFIANNEPVNTECPNCKNNYLLKRWTQQRGQFLECPNCKEKLTAEMVPLSADEAVDV